VEVKARVSKGEVKTAIEAALKRSAEVDSSRIKVETDGDKVTLRGTVRSWFEYEEAERASAMRACASIVPQAQNKMLISYSTSGSSLDGATNWVGRTAGQTRALLLAVAGGRTSHAAAFWQHVEKDRGAAGAERVATRRDSELGVE
jgi:hypothetical protein